MQFTGKKLQLAFAMHTISTDFTCSVATAKPKRQATLTAVPQVALVVFTIPFDMFSAGQITLSAEKPNSNITA